MYIMPMHKSMLLCFRTSSGGAVIMSWMIGLGVLLDVLPLSVETSGPKIASAKSTSFSTTGQSLIKLLRSTFLKFAALGAPNMWYSFLACFARSNSAIEWLTRFSAMVFKFWPFPVLFISATVSLYPSGRDVRYSPSFY